MRSYVIHYLIAQVFDSAPKIKDNGVMGYDSHGTVRETMKESVMESVVMIVAVTLSPSPSVKLLSRVTRIAVEYITWTQQ